MSDVLSPRAMLRVLFMFATNPFVITDTHLSSRFFLRPATMDERARYSSHERFSTPFIRNNKTPSWSLVGRRSFWTKNRITKLKTQTGQKVAGPSDTEMCSVFKRFVRFSHFFVVVVFNFRIKQ